MTGTAGLSADQAAVYDRQLRVWGLEVQNRLTAARVLIIGGDALAAEVAKNIVLAGVGHVGIADDTPCSQAAFGNFLVSADADPSSTVGQSSAQTLAAMNPLITVSAQPLAFGPSCDGTGGSGSGDAGTDGSGGGGSSSLTQASVEQLKHLVAGYDVVVSTRGVSSQEADGLEQAAAGEGGEGVPDLVSFLLPSLQGYTGVKQLYLAEVRGPLAVIFTALGPHHTFADKPSTPTPAQPSAPVPATPLPAVNGSKAAAGAAGVASARIVATGKESGQAEAAAGQPVQGPSARVIDYPPLSKALGRSVAQCGGRRPVHPLYQVVRAVRAFEAQEGRAVRAGDEAALKATAAALEAGEGAAPGSISTSLLESWVLDAGLALAAAPAAAVAGGVLANSIIRSISRVGTPLDNFFFFSLHDGKGMVERMVA
ncbi:hypothetical protein QJQ45_024315 [Haematococcus lacustris]|nr:hypothetical protein QJQ45_024315 [Haematococcus lacustris]